MKQIEIEVGKIKPNPFKKYINEGRLDKDRVAKMEESIEHGTLPINFYMREQDGKYELAHGHHRLAAVINKKGKNFRVPAIIVDYSDELMLVDMIRENLTHRDSDFGDTEDSCVLARAWLGTGAGTVKQFDSAYKAYKSGSHKKGKEGSEPLPDSCRSIAKFLSKQGKTISYETIRNYLLIHDNLIPELHKKVGKLENATEEKQKMVIGRREATELSKLDKEEQLPIYNAIKKENLSGNISERLIAKFKQADDLTKKRILDGKLDLDELNTQTSEDSIVEERWDSFNKEIFKVQQEPKKFKSYFFGLTEKIKSALSQFGLAANLKVFSPSEIKEIRKELGKLSEVILETDQNIEKILAKVIK